MVLQCLRYSLEVSTRRPPDRRFKAQGLNWRLQGRVAHFNHRNCRPHTSMQLDVIGNVDDMKHELDLLAQGFELLRDVVAEMTAGPGI